MSGVAGWLQYLVPLLGSGGSVAFLLAVPGPRPAWLVALVAGGAVASVALGLGLRMVERRAARRARRRERARYLDHLDRVAAEARRRASAQLASAAHLHPDPPRLLALVNRGDRLWERRPADDDFLHVRIGRGPVPLASTVRLDPGGGPLVEHDPELQSAAEDLLREARRLPGAPVTVPLRRLGVLAVTGPPQRSRSLVRSLVCQLAAVHSPEDLHLLAVFPPAARPDWDWLKWLPHARDPTSDRSGGPPRCLLAETPSQLADLLDREVRRRLDGPTPDTTAGAPGTAGATDASGVHAGTGTRPHLVVVVEPDRVRAGAALGAVADPDRVPGGPAHGGVLDELLERAAEVEVTVVWLARDISGEPSEVAVRVRLDDRGTATFEETAPGGRLVDGIHADAAGLALCEAIARRLAPLRLDRRPVAPPGHGSLRLLDLLGLDGARVDPATAWMPHTRSHLLRVPVGARPDGRPLVLDLREAAEGGIGPHGLVVGATGSGKSELLRTVVAGLAATHPPERLAFVLVDFKGGAAFAGLAALPQVAGLITNLQADLSMVDRAMAALQGEQVRRQRILHRAGNLPDLRAYAARREADPRLGPLPWLLIVVDEFGELLAARPQFLDLFAAIGRVGRSLGMHLLLASQRLDEGRLHGLDGHLRYRICLRTFSAAESTAVLGTPDAYHLPPAPGAAYLKVDATAPVRFTAALVGSRHPPRAAGATPSAADGAGLPRVVPFTPSRPTPEPVPHLSPGPDPGPAPGAPSDLETLVAGLAGAGPPVHQVWLPPLPAVVPLDGLLATAAPGWLRVPLGVVDRPVEQAQEPLLLDLSGGAGHLAVVGAPRSGKSTLLCTIVAALAATHRPDAVQVYALDLGGGLLHRLAGVPHVGAVCGPREPDRARRLVRELRRVVADRERRFRDLGVDSMASWHALRRGGLDLGAHGELFLMVDNWGALARELPELDGELTEFAATGLHYGVHLVLAANRWAELRPALRDNLGGRLELRLNDPLESEFGRTLAGALPELPGRGLTQPGLQFQAAVPGPTQAILDRALPGERGMAAPPLRMLPVLLQAAALPAPGRGQPAGVPFAVDEHRLEPVWLDLFAGPPHLLVLGDAECGKTSLLRLIASALADRHPPDEVALVVIDLRRGLPDLAGLPNLAGYACTPPAITETMERLQAQLLYRATPAVDLVPTFGVDRGPVAALDRGPASVICRSQAAGPRYVVLVDDYDLLPMTTGSPLAPLLDLLGQGRELGLHLILARSVAGAARASFEPGFQRLRELGGPGLIMSGDPGEGPLLSGQKASALPPGRGLLVRRRQAPTLVQVAYRPPSPPGRGGAPHPTPEAEAAAMSLAVTTVGQRPNRPGPEAG